MKHILLFLMIPTLYSYNAAADFGEIDLMTREAIEYEMLTENKTIDIFQDIYDLIKMDNSSDPNCDFEVLATLKVDERYGEEYKQPLACSVCFVYLDQDKTQADWQDAICD